MALAWQKKVWPTKNQKNFRNASRKIKCDDNKVVFNIKPWGPDGKSDPETSTIAVSQTVVTSLVGGFNPLVNISPFGSFPQVGMKIENI